MAETKKTFTFVISDESLNSYGFRVLTDGIDTSLFEKNPIALWVHSRPSGWDKNREPLPIGKWTNLRRDGKKLIADLEFDEDDEFAVSLMKKVEKGIINMVSAGLRAITTSDDSSLLVKGQTRPTVVQCLLMEASLVDIGSNRNALRLQDEFGTEINLSDRESNHLLPLLSDIQHQNLDMKFQEQIAQVLKLADNASEADVLAAVQNSVTLSLQVSGLQGQVNSLTTEKTNLQDQLKVYQDAEKAAQEQKRIDLVDQAIAGKKITASEKETYLSLAEKDFDNTKKILDGMQGVKELGDGNGGEVKLGAWDARMKEINDNLKKK
ncbi:MAG: hypothetical protein RBU23_12900 [Candidatus Auribacterota bacterium]|jgi:hypothetical protein|nr:hypothetical protein [Candidatus Auribacterota bacterium]